MPSLYWLLKRLFSPGGDDLQSDRKWEWTSGYLRQHSLKWDLCKSKIPGSCTCLCRLPVISALPESDPVRCNYTTYEGTRLLVFPFIQTKSAALVWEGMQSLLNLCFSTIFEEFWVSKLRIDFVCMSTSTVLWIHERRRDNVSSA